MYESVFEKSLIWIILLACFISLFLYFAGRYTHARVIFCNVGQGDGALIQLENNVELLVDAGPDQRILECLGKYMPFFDREIESVFISHAQKDHFGGLHAVSSHFKIDNLFISSNPELSKDFYSLVRQLHTNRTTIRYIYQGDEVDIDRAHLAFLWPPLYLSESQNKKLDPNMFSQVFVFSFNTMKILFTGDAVPQVLNSLSQQSVPKVTILKVPHHGSYNGLNEKLMTLAEPLYSVISVGKNNSYGHPSDKTLQLLEKFKSIIKRTDENGDITFDLE